jgi:hypothetical protein
MPSHGEVSKSMRYRVAFASFLAALQVFFASCGRAGRESSPASMAEVQTTSLTSTVILPTLDAELLSRF